MSTPSFTPVVYLCLIEMAVNKHRSLFIIFCFAFATHKVHGDVSRYSLQTIDQAGFESGPILENCQSLGVCAIHLNKAKGGENTFNYDPDTKQCQLGTAAADDDDAPSTGSKSEETSIEAFVLEGDFINFPF